VVEKKMAVATVKILSLMLQQKGESIMSVEQNKATISRVYEAVVNQRKLSLIDEIYTTDYVFHMAGMPDIQGAKGFKQFLAMYFAAFPDIHWTLEDIFAEGDKVVTRATIVGTHQEEFMGIPPTLKRVTITAIVIHRLASGKVVEDWGEADFLGLMNR